MVEMLLYRCLTVLDCTNYSLLHYCYWNYCYLICFVLQTDDCVKIYVWDNLSHYTISHYVIVNLLWIRVLHVEFLSSSYAFVTLYTMYNTYILCTMYRRKREVANVANFILIKSSFYRRTIFRASTSCSRNEHRTCTRTC